VLAEQLKDGPTLALKRGDPSAIRSVITGVFMLLHPYASD
jgi:hypothetical protein